MERKRNPIPKTLPPQDVGLFVAFNSVRRFIVRPEALRAGLYVRVARTLLLPSMTVEFVELLGRPYCRSSSPGTLRFQSRRKMLGIPMELNSDGVVETFANDLAKTAMAFRYNSKVCAFVDRLSQVDRLHQHCIILDRPFGLAEFNVFLEDVYYHDDLHAALDLMPF